MLTPVNTHSITQALERTPAGPVLAVCGAVCGCFVLNWADPTTPGGPTPLCPTKALFGIDCPGCGTARALYSLTHLDVSAAVRYNILAVVAVILVGWSWCVWLGRTLGKRVPDWCVCVVYHPAITVGTVRKSAGVTRDIMRQLR